MPSVSPEQQRLFGQAYAIKTGKLDPKDLDPKYRDQIVDLADSMSEKDLKDFAETKHSEMKKESKGMENLQSFEDFINESNDIINENAKKYGFDVFLNLDNLAKMQEVTSNKESKKELEPIIKAFGEWKKKYL
jgi:hypothetical protein